MEICKKQLSYSPNFIYFPLAQPLLSFFFQLLLFCLSLTYIFHILFSIFLFSSTTPITLSSSCSNPLQSFSPPHRLDFAYWQLNCSAPHPFLPDAPLRNWLKWPQHSCSLRPTLCLASLTVCWWIYLDHPSSSGEVLRPCPSQYCWLPSLLCNPRKQVRALNRSHCQLTAFIRCLPCPHLPPNLAGLASRTPVFPPAPPQWYCGKTCWGKLQQVASLRKWGKTNGMAVELALHLAGVPPLLKPHHPQAPHPNFQEFHYLELTTLSPSHQSANLSLSALLS